MTSKENSLNWFEISVSDIKRAKKFYETIFGIKMETQNMMGMEMAFFPYEPGNGNASGGLVQSHFQKLKRQEERSLCLKQKLVMISGLWHSLLTQKATLLLCILKNNL